MTTQSLIELPLSLDAKLRLYEQRKAPLTVFTTEELRELFYRQCGMLYGDKMPVDAYD